MRNSEFGMRKEKRRMTDGRCRMADDRCEVRSGGCGEGESGEPTPEVSQGRIVGYDSHRVIDDSMNDKIGSLSHEETDAADRPCQAACDWQSLPCGLKAPQKAPNEAQPESTQSSLTHGCESSAPEAAGHERGMVQLCSMPAPGSRRKPSRRTSSRFHSLNFGQWTAGPPALSRSSRLGRGNPTAAAWFPGCG